MKLLNSSDFKSNTWETSEFHPCSQKSSLPLVWTWNSPKFEMTFQHEIFLCGLSFEIWLHQRLRVRNSRWMPNFFYAVKSLKNLSFNFTIIFGKIMVPFNGFSLFSSLIENCYLKISLKTFPLRIDMHKFNILVR